MQFARLKRFSNNLTEELTTILNSLNFKCIFNPSYQFYKNKHYISFRGNSKLFKYKRGKRIIRLIEDTTEAFLIILDNKSPAEAALLGFLVYSVFDGTNAAIFKKYSFKAFTIDILWGTTLFFTTTLIFNYIKPFIQP